MTGASGFIGRQGLAPLSERRYEVHAVSSKAVNATGNVAWHRADLLDPAATRALLEQVRPTHLLHFAWYAIPGKYWVAPENLDWVAASLGLLREFARLGGQRAVLAGTCAEYDLSHEVLSEERTPLLPATLYGASKHALQTVFSRFAREAGLSGAWGRIFSLYGRQEYPQRLVASVITALLRGEPALCTEGSQVRDYLHVADVAAAFVALLDSRVEGAVNIGSGSGIELRELVRRIGDKLGRPELVRLGARPTPAGEPQRLIADAGRLRNEVGWTPRHDLDGGLDDTIAYWRQSLAAASTDR